MNTTKFEIYRNDLVNILDFDNLRHYIDDEAYSVDKQIEAYFKLYHPEYNMILGGAAGEPLSGKLSFADSVGAKREDVLIHVMVHNDWDDCTNTVSEIQPLKNQNKSQTNYVH